MKKLFSLILLSALFVINVFSQAEPKNDKHPILAMFDTLEVGNKKQIMRISPICYFEGYDTILHKFESFCYWMHFPSGYTLRWKVKNRKLYLSNDIKLTSESCSNEPILITNADKIAAIEELTNRKFNKNGLMLADWFSGTLITYLYEQDKEYFTTIDGRKIYNPKPLTMYQYEIKKGRIISKRKLKEQARPPKLPLL